MSSKTATTWETTRLQNLVRNHKSGRYYARFCINGKQVWKTLKTTSFSVAEARLAAQQKEHKERRKSEAATESAKMLFRHAADLHMKRLEGKVSIKSGTRHYWAQIRKAVAKSWPALDDLEVRRVTKGTLQDWAAKYAKGASPTRYNNSLAFVRHVLEVAVEKGVIYANPAGDLDRMPVRSKILELPTLKQFGEFIHLIRIRGGRFSKDTADFTEGLAYTGCRLGEAAKIEWKDLDFAADEIVVRGDPTERTKNGEIRRIPMIPAARKLFERMRLERHDEAKTETVFKVREGQKSMDRAAEDVGMARITHHDLRHLFATICIESGVDIPTVARWLGHKDGGVLAIKTYGHLRREHSAAQAKKVSLCRWPHS